MGLIISKNLTIENIGKEKATALKESLCNFILEEAESIESLINSLNKKPKELSKMNLTIKEIFKSKTNNIGE